MIDQDSAFNPPPRRASVWLAAGLVVAFLAGIALAAYVIHRIDRIGEIVRPVPAAPVVAQPVAVPPRPVIADPLLAPRVDRIEAEIATIRSRADEASGDADRAEGLLVAFAARRALDRGRSMGFLEPLLRRHFGGTEPRAVAIAIGAGQQPVTLDQLQQSFAEIEPALRAPAANENWWSVVRREFGGLFVIRKAGEPSALPVDRLSRAERALNQGHVDIALDEVAHMSGAGRADAWIAGARRYVIARNALDRLETAALLAPAGGGAPQEPR